ncbi:hypothetical protein CDAR_565041 [Caerostris darwini]|uniref:Uncharacterized protein n=1 Tax=Caerostris darwini TaxID=1538125 RepID=A0AAV4MA11_9ARAC|nr:hypothetical protein CDAR_565041 [Caerostris darwini]
MIALCNLVFVYVRKDNLDSGQKSIKETVVAERKLWLSRPSDFEIVAAESCSNEERLLSGNLVCLRAKGQFRFGTEVN